MNLVARFIAHLVGVAGLASIGVAAAYALALALRPLVVDSDLAFDHSSSVELVAASLAAAGLGVALVSWSAHVFAGDSDAVGGAGSDSVDSGE